MVKGDTEINKRGKVKWTDTISFLYHLFTYQAYSGGESDLEKYLPNLSLSL